MPDNEPMSQDDILNLILAPAPEPKQARAEQTVEPDADEDENGVDQDEELVDDDDDSAESTEDETPEQTTDDEEDGSEDDEDDEDEDEGEDEAEDEESSEDDNTVEYSDDDVVTVRVDGEDVETTLGELKKNYSLGQATERRLQDATEARKEWQAKRSKLVDDQETARGDLIQLMEAIKEYVAEPLLSEPDLKLLQTDPASYHQAKALYDKDQERVRAREAAYMELLRKQQGRRQESFKTYGAEQQQLLLEALPDLKDPKKNKQITNDIVNQAKKIGFSGEEIAAAADHRIYLMAYKAAQYDRLMGKVEAKKPKAAAGAAKPKVRRLAPGGAAKVGAQAAKRQKAALAAEEKARQTGSIADVAAMLLVKQPAAKPQRSPSTRKRTNGRKRQQ